MKGDRQMKSEPAKLDFGYEMPSTEEQVDATVELAESIQESHGCFSAILAQATCEHVETQAGPSFIGSAKSIHLSLLLTAFNCIIPWNEIATSATHMQESAEPYRFCPLDLTWCLPAELASNQIIRVRHFLVSKISLLLLHEMM